LTGRHSVAAYDDATVALTALKNRRQYERVKAAALRPGSCRSLLRGIAFDANGIPGAGCSSLGFVADTTCG
jgi:hypothetical protein